MGAVAAVPVAARYDAPLITGKTATLERERLYDLFRRGEISLLIVSKVANFSIDLPDASVAIQLSGTFGSRAMDRICSTIARWSFFGNSFSRSASARSSSRIVTVSPFRCLCCRPSRVQRRGALVPFWDSGNQLPQFPTGFCLMQTATGFLMLV